MTKKKNGDAAVDSSQAKGRTCKPRYYTINFNVLVFMDVLNCKGAESLVTRGTSKRSFQPLHQ